MLSGERAKEYNRGIALFHYGINPDGRIVEVVDPDYWTYHSSAGWYDKRTIGIELMNSSKSNRNPYTAEQYESLFNLIFDHLRKVYPSITRIVGHGFNKRKYSRKNKQCPGVGFDWSKLEAEMKTRALNSEKINKDAYIINGK